MSKLLKTDVPNLLKDPSSGALINTDMAGLIAARARKRSTHRIDQLENEVAELRSSLVSQSNNVEEILNILQAQIGNNK